MKGNPYLKACSLAKMASSKRDGSVVSWSAQQLFQLFADPMWANSDLCNIEIIVHETHQLRSHSSVLFFLFLLFLFLRLVFSSCHTRLMLYQFQSRHCAVGGTCFFSYTAETCMWIDSWRSRLSPGNFNTGSFSSSHLASSSVMLHYFSSYKDVSPPSHLFLPHPSP